MTPRNAFVVIFLVTCVVLNIFAFVLYRKNEEIRSASNWVQHTYEVISETQGAFSSIQDIVTSQRGYLLTGREEFLLVYDGRIRSLERDMPRLRDLVKDNPPQQARIDQLIELCREQRNLVRDQIKTFQQRHLTATFITPEDISASKKMMDKIRALVATILDEEKKLLGTRNAAEKDRQQDFTTTIMLSSAFSVLGMLLTSALVFILTRKRRQAEIDLKHSEERFALAIAGMRDGIYDWSIPDNKLYVSPRTKEMLGETDESMDSTVDALFSRIHPEDRPPMQEMLDQYFKRELPSFQHHLRLRHRNGSYRWFLFRGVGVWNAAGQIQRLVGGYTDITDQREFEDNLKRMNSELETFTYIASHDLRSPLVNLKGFAGEMKMGLDELSPLLDEIEPKLEPKQKEVFTRVLREDIPDALTFIHSSVVKMDRLTNGILELSRIGRRELRPDKVEVEKVVRNAINVLNHQIQTQNIEMVIGELPPMYSDYLSVEQVFGNIIDNAIKYLDPARPGRIEIDGETIGEINLYRIKDNGRGIADADMQKIFEIFRRAGNNEGIAGEGMGMSYVKATLRRLGGTIWCDSTKGKGSTFSFTFLNNLKLEPMEKAA